jgi:hypothetical protein
MNMKSLGATGRGYLGLSVRVLLVLMTWAFVATASVHAQGVGTGTAAVNIGDALGTPGGTANVTVSLATENEEAAAAQIDVMFDPELLSITAEDCVKDARLTNQTLNVFVLGDPADTVRIAVSDQSPPIAQLTAGALATCAFHIAEDAPFGDTDLIADTVVVGARSGQRICGPGTTDCDSSDGVVSIGEATATPTATNTPTRQQTPTNTPTRQATATSTSEATATVTPTVEGTATNTPEGGTPTNTPEVTVTNTVAPTATNTPPPTATSTEGQEGSPTATRTNTPGGGGAKGTEDDSCAIVPASQMNPMRSLILLVVPAMLLWGRRRRL